MKFAQLLLGMDARVENYADRLPRSSTNSFLLFAKGACKAPRSFSAIADLIPAQLSEIKNYDIRKWETSTIRPVLLCGRAGMSSNSVLMQFCGKIMDLLAATIFFLFGLRKGGRYCGTETSTIGIMASHHIVITVRHSRRMEAPSQASHLDVVVFSH